MLSPELFQQVRRIQIRARHLVDEMFAGEYNSIFKGRGMDFTEVREYEPGDDVRTIDWNVTARLGQPYVKQFVEERELTVMLLVDVSASGRFGATARSKADIVCELCAVLALSAIRNNDKVGLILFSDRIEKLVAPQKGRSRVLRIIRDLLAFEPASRGTDIGRALEYLNKIRRRRTVAFVISDFLAPDFERSLRIAHQRHDVIPITVTDRREDELPKVGLLVLEDLETGRDIVVDTDSETVRAHYRTVRERDRGQRDRLFRALGLDAVAIDTDEPFVRPLIRFFRERERRLWEGR